MQLRRGQNESGSDQEEPDGEPPEPDKPSLADEVKDLESFAFDKWVVQLHSPQAVLQGQQCCVLHSQHACTLAALRCPLPTPS